MNNRLPIIILVCFVFGSVCFGVTSKIARHASSEELLRGKAEDIVIGSEGTIELGLSAEVLAEEFKEDVWSVNSIVESGGDIFVGTSPNGGIYKYSLGKLTKIYPVESEGDENEQGLKSDDVKEPNDANKVEVEQYLSNEHIFAMATDVAGRLLAGISGKRCVLVRLEKGKIETIFEPNDTKYIFAIAIGDGGDIYLGTGPEGKIYKLNSFGKKPQLIYEAKDKNILSLAIGEDGFVYAGSDGRGLVYRIDPATKTATVLYDSDQDEITSLLFAGGTGDLYVAATSAKIVRAEGKFENQISLAGRPEDKSESGNGTGKSQGGLKLQVANTKKSEDGKPSEGGVPSVKPPKPTKASYIYKITRDGFVSDVFSETVVLFSMVEQQGKLIVGAGNSAELFAVEPVAEEHAVIYKDKQASQILAVVVVGEDLYIGTANPAKLIKLAKSFASEGTFASDLIDASQPAKWGKLQIEADIPKGCKVLVSSRSGNVEDVNDPTFSDWTKSVEVTGPVQLECPAGRFCQYKLVLQSKDGKESPVIREVAVAHTVPNLAPKVESVSVGRVEAAEKMGVFKIAYKSKDDNSDKLIYKIDFRKMGRTNWIELEEQIESDSFEWDGRTVEDGRYEIRVTANDERSNSVETKLTGSRISDPVVVDNTGPAIKSYSINKEGESVVIKLDISDQFSVVSKLDYTVDSNAEWIGAIPDDLVYDTTEENFTFVVEDLKPGEHIVSVKVSDDVGNMTYKTFEVNF